MMCESLRRKQLSAAMLQRETNTLQNNPLPVIVGPQTIDDLLINRTRVLPPDHQKPGPYKCIEREIKSPTQRDSEGKDGFVFQPRSMNPYASPKGFLDNSANYNGAHPRKYQQYNAH